MAQGVPLRRLGCSLCFLRLVIMPMAKRAAVLDVASIAMSPKLLLSPDCGVLPLVGVSTAITGVSASGTSVSVISVTGTVDSLGEGLTIIGGSFGG